VDRAEDVLSRTGAGIEEAAGAQFLEGSDIKLRSITSERGTGDSIPFIFACNGSGAGNGAGTSSADAFSGTLYMGEYLTAKFTATRRPYPAGSTTIVLPGGPPLAN